MLANMGEITHILGWYFFSLKRLTFEIDGVTVTEADYSAIWKVYFYFTLPCTLVDVDLSCLPTGFHISGQNAQCFFHVNTPSRMQYPWQ